ncbi:NADP-dependent oxidoreductase [Nocardia sp. NBC_00416]|uniref:NADP-dependent oxidoreductase n=1 Tax=Nocardia sp. NBC_00416 TaxID=2975991 RepID=UPI002E22FF3E
MLMTTVLAEDYGPPHTLQVIEAPVPQPGPGQIQVRIAAASVNPGELRLLAGEVRDLVPMTFPFIPGLDFAGTVTETGAGVERFAIGEEVFGWAAPRGFPWAADLAVPPSFSTGTMAEYAVFEADSPALAHRPDGLSVEEAAAMPTTGLTAWEIARQARLRTGQTALVIGATGGVGTILVPLLASTGARVLATASAADREHMLRLGADETIDHTRVNTITQALRLAPHGVDVLIDLILPSAYLPDTAGAAAPGGRIVTVSGRYAEAVPGREDLAVTAATTRTEPGDLEELARRVLSAQVPITICRQYTLDNAPQAYSDLSGKHTLGKLVITV